MDHTTVLIGLAQISLVLTGFVTVFMGFFAGEDPPSKPDVHHAFAMLAGSVLVLLLALVPIVLGGYGFSDSQLWYWSSISGVLMGMVFGASIVATDLKTNQGGVSPNWPAPYVFVLLPGNGCYRIDALECTEQWRFRSLRFGGGHVLNGRSG